MEKLLNESIQKQILELFKDLKHPVSVLYFGSKQQNCETCEQTQQLLGEVAELSPLVHLDAYDMEENPEMAQQYRIDKVPAIALATRDGENVKDARMRYFGIPAGSEFTTLINDILLVGRRDSGLAKETRQFLHSLSQPLNLQVFVTTSCPHCPRAAVLAHQMAFESENVDAWTVEAMEFPALADEYGVGGVPHTAINFGKGEMIGAAPEAMLVEQIRVALSAQ